MSSGGGHAAGAWSPPTDQAIAGMVLREWGLAGALTPLPSYADANRRLHGTDGDCVVKLAHPDNDVSQLDLENRAMLHLQQTGCRARTPRLRLTLEGSPMVRMRLDDGRHAQLRLVEFIDGPLLAAGPVDAALARSVGEQVAWLAQGLSGFAHPAAHACGGWNLSSLPALADAIDLVDDLELRCLVRAGLEDFAQRLPAWESHLPRQVIHNDPNDHNLIVDLERRAVRAVIDFGDMCHGFRLADLAIACIHAIQADAAPGPVMDAVVAGYASVSPLLGAEREALPRFIRARLCQSILMAERARRADPGNPYVMISQPAVRALLRTLA